MDTSKPFELATRAHAPKSPNLFGKVHIVRHPAEALDKVPESEYGGSPAAAGATSRARIPPCCRAERTSRSMARAIY